MFGTQSYDEGKNFCWKTCAAYWPETLHILQVSANTAFFRLQMLLDPMGGIVMTNDGNAILREVSFS